MRTFVIVFAGTCLVIVLVCLIGVVYNMGWTAAYLDCADNIMNAAYASIEEGTD